MDDLQLIRNLSYEYTFCLDEGDFDAVATLMARATLVPVMAGVRGKALRGAYAIRSFYADQVVTYRDGDPRTRHLITNHAISISGQAAAARCYFTVLQKPPRLPYAIVVGGQYRDRFVKEDGAWRFAEKAIQVDYLNDIGHHFLISPAHRETDAS